MQTKNRLTLSITSEFKAQALKGFLFDKRNPPQNNGYETYETATLIKFNGEKINPVILGDF